MPSKTDAYDTLQVESRAAWRAWLTKHHATSPGIWLVTVKEAAGDRHLSWDAIVDEALCFGWIDSTGGKVDAERTKRLITRHKLRSPWSALNKRRVVTLVEDGLMTPAGQVRVDAAKANGDWTVYDNVETLAVPDDLAAALAAIPSARPTFDALAKSKRKLFLAWVESAKRPETRAKRIATLAADLPVSRIPLDGRAKQGSTSPSGELS